MKDFDVNLYIADAQRDYDSCFKRLSEFEAEYQTLKVSLTKDGFDPDSIITELNSTRGKFPAKDVGNKYNSKKVYLFCNRHQNIISSKKDLIYVGTRLRAIKNAMKGYFTEDERRFVSWMVSNLWKGYKQEVDKPDFSEEKMEELTKLWMFPYLSSEMLMLALLNSIPKGAP